VDKLRFCRDEHCGEVKRVLYIGEILKLRSFRRKDSYYLGTGGRTVGVQFWGSCPLQRVAGIPLAGDGLQQKRLFSRADSFKNYMSTLVPGQGEQLVVLR
jgi:hypothetical protein